MNATASEPKGIALEMASWNVMGLAMRQEPFLAFLATYGRDFKAASKPKGVRYRTPKCCFTNVSKLVSVGKHRDQNWTYCEGLACWRGIWFHHAWAADRDGNVIDPTWRITAEEQSSVRYFGVSFERLFAFVHTNYTSVLQSILVEGVEPNFAGKFATGHDDRVNSASIRTSSVES